MIFGLNGKFAERKRVILVKWGICKEKTRDFLVKWKIPEEKGSDFCLNGGFE